MKVGLIIILLLKIAFGDLYNVSLCDGMRNELCIKTALNEFNYTAKEIRRMTTVMRKITENRIACKAQGQCPQPKPAVNKKVECNGGVADQWTCNNVDLLSFTPLSELGSSSNADGNDIWGWTDPSNNKRYVITGQTDGASIVDITDSSNPNVLCFIPSRISINTIWRDQKVTNSEDSEEATLLIVADRSGQGLQYLKIKATINLCESNKESNSPYIVTDEGSVQNGYLGWVGSGIYTGGTNTHNIVALDTVFGSNSLQQGDTAYIVGSNSCSGGLLAVKVSGNIPEYAGCFSADGYTHDAQCWIYSGPDTRYTGRNICVGYNENSITIIDMTIPTTPLLISRLTYSTSRYTHQGWISSNQEFLFMNDELDESGNTVPSQTTYIVNIKDLVNPILTPWASGVQTIDHNLYVKNINGIDYVIEANYRAGLRILEFIQNGNNGDLKEVGWFKTWTGSLSKSFNGAWSTYSYFADEPNLVALQDIEQGLFLLDISKIVNQQK